LAITLGKDCTVDVDGQVAGVRSVTFTESARTIDVNEFGSRYSSVYSTGFDASVSIELNDDDAVGTLITALQDGTEVTVSGGMGGWSFPAVVTGVSESCPIDGVVTYTIEARITKEGLR
jgi:hypothetical protein